MIWLKMGVWGTMQPEMAEGFRQVSKLYAQKSEDVYVTSIRDGQHSQGSFHPSGRAIDIRYPQYFNNDSTTAGEKMQFLEDINEVLGVNYDVIFENSHIHIEYDPK